MKDRLVYGLQLVYVQTPLPDRMHATDGNGGQSWDKVYDIQVPCALFVV
jgi:hypothetical protein